MCGHNALRPEQSSRTPGPAEKAVKKAIAARRKKADQAEEEVSENGLLERFMYTLPRQARDKRRESTQKRVPFSCRRRRSDWGLPRGAQRSLPS
jgi:hypothetical protein